MVDADVVAVDVRVFRAIGGEVSSWTREIRKRECIYVVERKSRKRTTSRTVTQIVSRDRCAVGSEYCSLRSIDSASASKGVRACCSRSQ